MNDFLAAVGRTKSNQVQVDLLVNTDLKSVDEFERLIEVLDRDLLSWITGEAEVPENYDTPVFRRLKAFHHHERPIHV